MKSKYLLDILNYEYPVTALNSNTLLECSAENYDPNDLSRDFWIWRSNTTQQIEIYFEISESDSLDTFALLRTNLSLKAQVYISGSNSSGVGGFNTPIFSRSLTQQRSNWILHSKNPLPSAQYYKLTIVDDQPVTTYFEIAKILAGKSEEFPFEIVDGWSDSKESYQKRETQKGQWRPGSENAQLNILDIKFRPAFGTTNQINNEYSLIHSMMTFIEQVKTTRPFLIILNPDKPQEWFDYVTIAGDEIIIDFSEADMTEFSFQVKELK